MACHAAHLKEIVIKASDLVIRRTIRMSLSIKPGDLTTTIGIATEIGMEVEGRRNRAENDSDTIIIDLATIDQEIGKEMSGEEVKEIGITREGAQQSAVQIKRWSK